jgi:acetyltransferase-like isoleucine patch superfamily enzyme
MKSVLKKMLYAGLPVPGVVRPVIRAGYRAGVFLVESLVFLKKLLWVEPVLRSVCKQVGKGLRAERLPYMRGDGDLSLGDNVNLSGRSCFYFMSGMDSRPSIYVGGNTFIGNGCTFSCAKRISIGSHCLISAGVRIHDNDGHPIDPVRRRVGEPIRSDESAEVSIEDNVWIGAQATIMKGVTIGENSVVATGAIVTQAVPANSIVAGNPARVVKELGAERQAEGTAGV